MVNFFELVLILVIIVLAVWVWFLLKKKIGKGLAGYNQKLQAKKNEAKERIMAMLEGKSEINNREAAKALSVSRYTAARYFDELEKEGQVKQIGKTGRDVIYKKL